MEKRIFFLKVNPSVTKLKKEKSISKPERDIRIGMFKWIIFKKSEDGFLKSTYVNIKITRYVPHQKAHELNQNSA